MLVCKSPTFSHDSRLSLGQFFQRILHKFISKHIPVGHRIAIHPSSLHLLNNSIWLDCVNPTNRSRGMSPSWG